MRAPIEAFHCHFILLAWSDVGRRGEVSAKEKRVRSEGHLGSFFFVFISPSIRKSVFPTRSQPCQIGIRCVGLTFQVPRKYSLPSPIEKKPGESGRNFRIDGRRAFCFWRKTRAGPSPAISRLIGLVSMRAGRISSPCGSFGSCR